MLHSVTSAALRALPEDAVQEMDKALQLNSINVSKWQAAMIVIQGWSRNALAPDSRDVAMLMLYFTVLSFVIEHELLYT